MNEHECPMCALGFTGTECHSSCPLSHGCNMIRCPRCGYEYVESGIVVSLVKRLLRKREAAVSTESTEY